MRKAREILSTVRWHVSEQTTAAAAADRNGGGGKKTYPHYPNRMDTRIQLQVKRASKRIDSRAFAFP